MPLHDSTFDVRITQFVGYASTPPNRRRNFLRDTGGYAFYKDFYLRLRRALTSDRRTTRDGAAVHAAAQNATHRYARRYGDLAPKWTSQINRWASSTNCDVEPVTYPVCGLNILVTVPFAELYPDGTVELVFVRLAKEPFDGEVIDMMLRLVQRAYAESLPDAVVTFVDLENGTISSTAGRDLSGHDFWIDTDAAGLAYALREGGQDEVGAA